MLFGGSGSGMDDLMNLVVVDKLTGGSLFGSEPRKKKRKKKVYILVPDSLPIYNAQDGSYPGHERG